jgi:hypothetical protein
MSRTRFNRLVARAWAGDDAARAALVATAHNYRWVDREPTEAERTRLNCMPWRRAIPWLATTLGF